MEGKREKKQRSSIKKSKEGEVSSEGETLIRSTELELLREIASGHYGVVYEGKCRGQTVAIKILHNQHLTEKKLAELKTEVDIMRRLRHPCIVLFMGLCTERDHIALVMEYIEGKDLGRVIRDNELAISLSQRLQIAQDIAKGCNWLHCLNPPIIHRDLKPDNIMVTKDFQVKVCDFGLSCVKEEFDPKAKPKDTAVGTPVWMAPEVLCGIPASEYSDVYAYGLILWEIFTRQGRPFANATSFEEFCDDLVDRAKRPPIPDDVAPGIRALIEECWAQDRFQRPSFGRIVSKIDEIAMELLISDPEGRAVWRKAMERGASAGSSVHSHHPFLVKWDDFVASLAERLGLDYRSQDPPVLCLAEMLADYYQDLTLSSRSRNVVTCAKFGKFLEMFGPLSKNAIIDFINFCSLGYFHGEIDSEQAVQRLTGEKRGTFLVRLSSGKDNCITISKVISKGGDKFHHQRAFRIADSGKYVIQVGKSLNEHDSIAQLIRSVSGELGLKRACIKANPFHRILNTRPAITNEYVGATSFTDLSQVGSMLKNVGIKD